MNARAILRPYPVALLVLVAVLATVWAVNRPAGAQTTQEVVFVDNFGVTPDSHGYFTLDFRDPSVTEVWATCNGAWPQGGTFSSRVPSQVMSRKPDPRIITLRLFNNTGQVITTFVRINCAFDVVGPAPAAPTALRQRLARVIHQADR
jgi:hypothetical protein